MCPNCNRIIPDKDLVQVDTGERKLMVIPIQKTMCKQCIKEYNKAK